MKPAAATQPSAPASTKPALALRRASPRNSQNFTKLNAEQHVISILRGAERRQYAPLDAHVRQYFYNNREDLKPPKLRREISNKVYHLTTWRGLLDYIVDPTGLKYVSWEDRLAQYKKTDIKANVADKSLPLHIRCSLPRALVDRLLRLYSIEKVLEIAHGSNHGAPLTIRINPAKITREDLIRRLKEKYSYEVKACERSPFGITFVWKPMQSLQLTTEFKEGMFEIQDEASQIAALMVDPKPGQQVLDFCAGSGGKSLTFAHKVGNTGMVHLHDIPQLLQMARKRIARAGVERAEFYSLEQQTNDEEYEGVVDDEEERDSNRSVSAEKTKVKVPRAAEGVTRNLEGLVGNMDWVLADVPCSGTGVYRRNPDMRWRFSDETLTRLMELQNRVAKTAVKFVAPKGRFVYATCSVLKEENEDQIDKLMKDEKLEIVGEPFRTLPQHGGMDGFFAAVLRRT